MILKQEKIMGRPPYEYFMSTIHGLGCRPYFTDQCSIKIETFIVVMHCLPIHLLDEFRDMFPSIYFHPAA